MRTGSSLGRVEPAADGGWQCAASCGGVGELAVLTCAVCWARPSTTSAQQRGERQRIHASTQACPGNRGGHRYDGPVRSGGVAHAAFPDFTGCTATNLEKEACLDIQNRAGTQINIKGFRVPLGESLEIRGMLRATARHPVFEPPTGTNGFFATAVPVPGGLLGIEWIPGNTVLAITELAGPHRRSTQHNYHCRHTSDQGAAGEPTARDELPYRDDSSPVCAQPHHRHHDRRRRTDRSGADPGGGISSMGTP